MKKLLILMLSIVLFAMSCHFQPAMPITETPTVSSDINANPNTLDKSMLPTTVNILVIPGTGEYLVDRNGEKLPVLLKSVSPIYADPLPEGIYIPPLGRRTTQGDTCLVLPFQVESQIPKEQYLNITALGYDSKDNLVSYCLDWGPIFGSTVIDMKPNSINDWSLDLSPSKDLVKVKIQVLGLSDIVPP